MKLKIAGIEHEVIFFTPDAEKNLCGTFNRITNTIEVNNSISIEHKEITLLHEVFHILVPELREMEIDSLAILVRQLLKDNPHVFKFEIPNKKRLEEDDE